jgi:hypothetical protein
LLNSGYYYYYYYFFNINSCITKVTRQVAVCC